MFNDELFVYGDQNVQVPAHLNFGKFMLDQLRKKKDEIALENGETDETLTYKELTDYAVKLSVGLTQLGVNKGDMVALGTEKRIHFIPTGLAIILSGATFTPYDYKCGRARLRHMMSITQPKYFIVSKQFWDNYKEVLESFKSIKSLVTLDKELDSMVSVESMISSDIDVERFEPVTVQGQVDTACVFYSSGTTGMPKGVQIAHLNCILYSSPHNYVDDSLQIVYTGEWYHSYDLFLSLEMLRLGRKILFVTNIEPEIVLRVFKKCEVNIAFLVPSMIIWMSQVDENIMCELNSMKVMFSASSPLHLKTIDQFKERFPSIKHVIQGYGMTETGMLTTENLAVGGIRSGSIGRAVAGVTLKVVHPESRKILGPNEHGEICVRGPMLMKGYIGIDASSYLDDDGFFRTGDLGYYDEDGYFYIIDRLKEILKYDGDTVVPLELETILMLHPEVREAGVVGKPDPMFGDLPTAFVVRKPDSSVTEQELIDFVSAEVPVYMQLRGGVRFIPKIPRNPIGKILRRQLREMLNEA